MDSVVLSGPAVWTSRAFALYFFSHVKQLPHFNLLVISLLDMKFGGYRVFVPILLIRIRCWFECSNLIWHSVFLFV